MHKSIYSYLSYLITVLLLGSMATACNSCKNVEDHSYTGDYHHFHVKYLSSVNQKPMLQIHDVNPTIFSKNL